MAQSFLSMVFSRGLMERAMPRAGERGAEERCFVSGDFAYTLEVSYVRGSVFDAACVWFWREGFLGGMAIGMLVGVLIGRAVTP